MSATSLEVFDKTLQTTNIWLNEVSAEIGPDRQLAWHVLGTVLRALRDRLPTDLAAHVGAELPLLIRGAYYDRYRPAEQPRVTRSLDEFLQRIADELQQVRPVDAEAAARAVFSAMNRHFAPGQITKAREALPLELRKVWPEPGTEGRAGGKAH